MTCTRFCDSLLLLIVCSLGYSTSEDANLGCPKHNPCVYYTDGTTIKGIDINGSKYNNPELHRIYSGPSTYAIDIDINTNMMYWSEQASSWKIRSINLTDGSIKDLITEDLGEVEGIAVDWINHNLYWTDLTFEKIEVSTLDGLYRKTLFTKSDTFGEIKILNNPKAIVVHPTKGYLFWTDFHYYYPQLARSTLAGTDYKMIRDLYYYFHFSPTGLAIDYDTDRLYFINGARTEIESFNFDGGERRQHHIAGHNPYPNDMTLLRQSAYWGDYKSHSVEEVNRITGQRMGTFGWLSVKPIFGVVGYDPSHQKPGNTSCTTNNGNCSHLCLPTPSGRSCACPNGVELLSNKLNCSNITVSVPPPQFPVVSVVLVEGRFPSEGRVEVYYSGIKGTVCDDYFGIEEANVVCRMLNYTRATHFYKRAYFGKGSGVIWLDSVKCKGNEKSISECQHAGWGENDCRHAEDVGVRCFNGTRPPNVTSPYTDPQGLKVRLVGGYRKNEGRVEVNYQNEWGSICDLQWTIQDANVVCKMLDYAGAWGAQGYGYFGQSTGKKIMVSNLVCSGNESSIGLCYSSGWGNPTCSHAYDVSVTCKVPPSQISDSATLRLIDGFTPNEGRVEIKHKGVWGTICDDQWDIRDAQVACKQLGFPGALSAPGLAAFGQGSGVIALSLFRCNGNEASLQNCSHSEWGATICVHSEDASVVCRSNDTKAPIEDSSSYLFVSDQKRGFLRQILHKTDNTNHSSSVYVVKGLKSPDLLAVDPIARTVYITDGSSIYMSQLFHNGTINIPSQGTHISGLAVDYLCKKLYWSDYYGNRIMVANVDGSLARSLMNVDSPKDIALDLKGGVMYYISGFASAKIYMSHMDGSHNELIKSLTSSPTSIAYDNSKNLLYWSDTNTILYLNLSSSVTRVLSSVHVRSPYGLTVHSGYLYWTDRKSGGFTGGLYRARLNSSASHETELVFSGLMTPGGVASFDSNSTLPENLACADCSRCSQMCLRVPKGIQCVCSGIYQLSHDNNTCVLADFFAYVDAYKETANFLPANAVDTSINQESISLKKSFLPRAVEWDPVEHRIYYSDSSRDLIARLYLNGTSEEVIVSNIRDPRALAIDHISRNLYFTDFFSQSIFVSKLDGSNKKTLRTHTLGNKPASIAVYAETGYLYYGTWGTQSQIHRASMDGTGHTTLIKWRATYDNYGPTAMTIDKVTNKLLWVGWHDAYIEYIDLSRTTPMISQIRSYQPYLWMPGGIALSQPRVCWADQFKGGMFCGNLNGTLSVQTIVKGVSGIKGLQYCKAKPEAQSEHPCASASYGSCTHLCLLKPGGYSCACPDNLPDNTTCAPYPLTTTSQPTTTEIPTTTRPTTTEIPTTTRPTTTEIPTTTRPTTTETRPSTEYEEPCQSNPCVNEGTCQVQGQSYSCVCLSYFVPTWSCAIFAGEGVVTVVIQYTFSTDEGDERLRDEFKRSLVRIMNKENTKKRRRRDTGKRVTEKDIFTFGSPKRTGNNVGFELAVVRSSPDGKLSKSSVVPAKSLEKTITDSKEEITKILQSKFGNVKVSKVDSTPVRNPLLTSKPPQKSKISKGAIAAVVVVVLLVILSGIALFIYCSRRRRGSLNLNNKYPTSQDMTTISNPGYMQEPEDLQLKSAVRFSNIDPLDNNVSNPTYEAMAKPTIENTKKEPEHFTPENQYSDIPVRTSQGPPYAHPNDIDQPQYQDRQWVQFEEPLDKQIFPED